MGSPERCPYHSQAWGVRCDRDMGHPDLCLSAGGAFFAPGYVQPAPADAPPRRGVYAVRFDDRTGRYAAAITRNGVDILHLHVGSERNTAENVRAVVDAMNAAHPADDASGAEGMPVAWALTDGAGGPPCGPAFMNVTDAALAAGRSGFLGVVPLYAAPLPARDDAVEEAASKVVEAAKRWRSACWNRPLTAENVDRDNEAQYGLREAVNRLLAAERAAALRRAKGGA